MLNYKYERWEESKAWWWERCGEGTQPQRRAGARWAWMDYVPSSSPSRWSVQCNAQSRGVKLQQILVWILALSNSPVTLGYSVYSLGLTLYLSFEMRIIILSIHNVPWLLNGIRTWGAWQVAGAYLVFNKCSFFPSFPDRKFSSLVQ